MFKSPLTPCPRHSLRIPVKALCLAAGVAFAFSPGTSFAQSKKAAADKKPAKEAPAEEAKEETPPVTPRDEETALKEFKTDMAALKKWSNEQEAKAKANPVIGLKMIKTMSEKINKVRTDGLPTEIASEYKTMGGIISKMAVLFKGMPEDEAEFMTWAQSKFSDAEFGAKMEELGTAAKASGEKLKEIGKKYGIKDLDFDSKDEKEAEEDGDDEKKPEKSDKDDDEKDEKPEKDDK